MKKIISVILLLYGQAHADVYLVQPFTVLGWSGTYVTARIILGNNAQEPEKIKYTFQALNERGFSIGEITFKGVVPGFGSRVFQETISLNGYSADQIANWALKETW